MATETAAATPPASNSHSSSPGRARQRKYKRDPFLSLPEFPTSASPSPDRSPGSENHDPFEDQQTESLLTRVFLTPLLFSSFLLSLFLVDRRTRQWRASQHSNAESPSLWTRFSPSAWLGPEPYHDSSASTDRKHDPGTRRDSGKWYVKKKHRKTGKLALDDAFELRSSVIVVMAAVWVIVLLGLLWSVKKLWSQLVA